MIFSLRSVHGSVHVSDSTPLTITVSQLTTCMCLAHAHIHVEHGGMGVGVLYNTKISINNYGGRLKLVKAWVSNVVSAMAHNSIHYCARRFYHVTHAHS